MVRKDLHMGAGKVAAQVAHAAVLGSEKVKRVNPRWYQNWFASGQPKVVVRVKSNSELAAVRKHAQELALEVVQVEDSGLTQVSPGTTTCIGIGPAPAELIDRVTSHLKLL